MENREGKDNFYLGTMLFSLLFLCSTLYFWGYGFFDMCGLTHPTVTEFVSRLGRSMLTNSYLGRLYAGGILFLSVILKYNKGTEASWGSLILWLVVGLFIYLFPWLSPTQYVLMTIIGYIILSVDLAYIGRKINGWLKPDNDRLETFEQCTEKLEGPETVNIPTIFQYQKKKHHGWINLVNPYRAILILGTPGSGKSFSIINPIIEQMVQKGFTGLIYDFKYPDLSEKAYNEYLLRYPMIDDPDHPGQKKQTPGAPKFCVINFDDPRTSMRCNPISAKYITDPADTTEIADIIMRNVNGEDVKNDFFGMSAKSYIDLLILFLARHDGGKFCTFPHLIELMGRNFKAVFRILEDIPECKIKLTPFINALQGNAQEQLQGQIASAQIPLMRFASPALWWVLSGDDFDLRLSDPDDPKILVLGNNPDREGIYGTTLALFLSRVFRCVNHKNNLPCGVVLDEFPTVKIKDVDKVIATARANKVCMCLAAQDKSQIIRDYGEKDANTVFNTVGSIIAGQVNGSTAKELAEMFGREFREQQSQTTGGESDTINKSFQQQEIFTQSTIEQLSQGYFCGRVADDQDYPIKQKYFAAKVQVDIERHKRMKSHWQKIPRQPNPAFNDDEIRDNVLADPGKYAIEYLVKQLKEDEIKEANKCSSYNYSTDAMLYNEAACKWDEMNADEKENLVGKVIDYEQRANMNAVMLANYNKIQDDITSLFIYYNVDEKTAEKTMESTIIPR